MEKKISFSSNLIYFIIVCLFVVMRMLSTFGVFSGLGEVWSYALNAFLQIGILLLFSFFAFKFINKRTVKQTLGDFGYQKISWKTLLISIVIGLVIFFLTVFVSSFFNSILTAFGYTSSSSSSSYDSVWSLILGLVFSALVPAICEESLHRGMLLLGNRGLGVKGNILLTGLLFGLLHLNIEQFFYATLIGFLLGFVAYVTRSIYPCMIIHFMNNAISVILSYTQTTHGTIGVFTYFNNLITENTLLAFILIVLFILLLALCLYMLIRMLIRQSLEDQIKRKRENVEKLATKLAFFSEWNEMKAKDKGEKFEDDLSKLPLEDTFELFSMQAMKDIMDKNPSAIVLPKSQKVKMETKTKILVIASIVLSGLCTLFTLIWGFL